MNVKVRLKLTPVGQGRSLPQAAVHEAVLFAHSWPPAQPLFCLMAKKNEASCGNKFCHTWCLTPSLGTMASNPSLQEVKGSMEQVDERNTRHMEIAWPLPTAYLPHIVHASAWIAKQKRAEDFAVKAVQKSWEK